ncbi:hypothetical protein D210916BOD24_00370 [Alteromonas sp. D210916BOD_24]|uniref:hypothetical protein n=1 Tax=Alteromonas sp. D210916BOD_24 TaxID=3157618 RepID=UPI00399C4F29
MSDWDFLHDMHDQGYSPDQIADAAACGYNPDDWEIMLDDEELDEIRLPSQELIQIFDNLVSNAKEYYQLTGRYLQIWGELGELFAEIEFGIIRHKPHTKGSDGKLGNDFIEIKTISPEKTEAQIQVKRSGNFNKLLIIRISHDFTFESRFVRRKNISKGDGKYARVSWPT